MRGAARYDKRLDEIRRKAEAVARQVGRSFKGSFDLGVAAAGRFDARLQQSGREARKVSDGVGRAFGGSLNRGISSASRFDARLQQSGREARKVADRVGRAFGGSFAPGIAGADRFDARIRQSATDAQAAARRIRQAFQDAVDVRAPVLAPAAGGAAGGGGGGGGGARGGAAAGGGFFGGGRDRGRSSGGSFNRGTAGFLNRLGEFAENMEELGEAARMAGLAILATPLAGDRMAQSLGMINAEIQDTEKSAEVYDQLYQVVRRTGAGLMETAKAFANFNSVMEDNGQGVGETVDVMAGLQTAMAGANMQAKDMNAVIDRIGKALEEGKFGKANFAALLDVPQLAEHLQEAFGVSREGLRQLIVDQKLATRQLIAPMMSFAAKMKDEIGGLPPAFRRDFRNLLTTAERFAAEIDKTFRFGDRLALMAQRISAALERWREKIPIIHDLIGGFEGLAAAARTLGITLALAFSPQILAAMGVMLRRLLLFYAPLALIAALIDEIFVYLTGGDSFLNDLIGPADQVLAGLNAKFQELKAQVQGAFDAVKEALRPLIDDIRAILPTMDEVKAGFQQLGAELGAAFGPALPLLQELAGLIGGLLMTNLRGLISLAPMIGELFMTNIRGVIALVGLLVQAMVSVRDRVAEIPDKVRALSEGFNALAAVVQGALLGAFNAVTAAIQRMWDLAKSAAAWMRENLSGMQGEGAGTDPEAQAQRRRNFQNRFQGLYPGVEQQSLTPQIDPGRMMPPNSAVNAPQTNTINNNVTVNATGSSGAEVASGTRQGVLSASRDAILDLARVGRDLGVAMPRGEVAAA
jgi:Flp pilus assembly pilin Flp